MTKADWSGLFELGVAFRAQAPWRWMGEGLFGVRVPGSDDVGWCLILGSGGELEGISIYLGDAGFETYRIIRDSEGLGLDDYWGQRAVALCFGDREDVSAKQRALFKQHGFKFRGRGAWPSYTEHRVGYVTRDLPAEHVAFMSECLRQCIAVAERAQADPGYPLVDAQGRLLVVAGDQVERVPEPPPLPVPPAPQPDQVALGRIRARTKHGGPPLELGLCSFFEATLDSPEGQYIPAMAMILDTDSGVLLGQELSEPARRERLVQDLLMKTVLELGVRPRALFLSSPAAARALAPVTESLDIPVELVERLHLFEEARGAMTGFFGGP